MVDKVGTKTDKTTQAGRDVYITPEGESVSEKSVTLKVGDEYVNVPSIHDGIMYSEDAIYDMLVEGSIKPTSKHKTVEDAVKAAQERSDNLVFAEGGTVPMKEQMSMFEDGGLMDEGGTVDPVSGNDVPSGSTQEEVRDDIPAQLSEGEFVFPADVVRFIGLGNLMRIRQEAKMGLKQMEAMGQMGNSDEATMPDDLPFDINDIDMEDDGEYNDTQEFAVGGMPNPNTGVYFNPAAGPTTGVAATPTQAASQTYVQQPQQAAVPTMQSYQDSEVPTFQQTLGDDAFGTYDELRQYTNEAGNILNVPFRNGQPISPIPEGYTFVDPEATKTEEVVTTPTQTQSTSVRNQMDEGDGESGGPEYATTDVSGIGYDKDSLTDNLKETISNYGSGFGTLSDAFGKAGALGIFQSLKGDQRTGSASSISSSAFGGVIDAVRGGDVSFTEPGKIGRSTGKYSDTRSLSDMLTAEQNTISTLANSVLGDMKNIFVDDKGKTRTEEIIRDNLVREAAKYGIKTRGKFGNYPINTLARNIAKAKTLEKKEQARIAQDKAQQAKIDSGQYSGVSSSEEFSQAFGDDGGSGGFSDSFGDTGPNNEGSGGISDAFGGGDYKGAYVGEKYIENKAKRMTKQMKRSGLASKK